MGCTVATSYYKGLLEAGVPREIARGVLPLNTYSRMFATVDLHNLFHFLKLRLDPHAQWEIRQYAQALLELVEPICPVAVREWRDYHLPRAHGLAAGAPEASPEGVPGTSGG